MPMIHMGVLPRNLLLFTVFMLSLVCISQTYTLTDDDVFVEDGVLKNCTYSYNKKDIIVPEILQGQLVIGVGFKAFEDSPIASLVLPSSIRVIERFAFYGSRQLESVNFTDLSNLREIGASAFSDCHKITSVNLNECKSLQVIGQYAFYFCSITSLDLNECSELSIISNGAFGANGFEFIDLTCLKNLRFIGHEAFSSLIKELYLPSNDIDGFTFWIDENGTEYNENDRIIDFSINYWAVFPAYKLLSENVVVVNGSIVEYNHDYKHIHIEIPEYLDGQIVTKLSDNSLVEADGHTFDYKGLVSVKFPPTIEMIASCAFMFNYLTTVDLSSCTNLHAICSYSFLANRISELLLNEKIEFLGVDAFASNLLDSINLNRNTSLSNISQGAFNFNNFSKFQLPIPDVPATFEKWEAYYGILYNGGDYTSDLSAGYDVDFSDYESINVTLLIRDSVGPIRDASVTFSNQLKLTGDDGKATFTVVNHDMSYSYKVSASNYTSASGTVDIEHQHSTRTIGLNPTVGSLYSVEDTIALGYIPCGLDVDFTTLLYASGNTPFVVDSCFTLASVRFDGQFPLFVPLNQETALIGSVYLDTIGYFETQVEYFTTSNNSLTITLVGTAVDYFSDEKLIINSLATSCTQCNDGIISIRSLDYPIEIDIDELNIHLSGSSDYVINNLPAGIYQVKVSINGYTIENAVEIRQSEELTVQYAVRENDLHLNITGGKKPYNILLNDEMYTCEDDSIVYNNLAPGSYYVEVSGAGSGEMSSFSFAIGSYGVFPNPLKDNKLVVRVPYLENASVKYSIILMDGSIQQVGYVNIVDSKFTLDVTFLISGTYLIHIEDVGDERCWTFHFIK